MSVLTGDYTSALTSYETAAALSDQHDLVGIEHKIGSVLHRRGDFNVAQSHLEVAFNSRMRTTTLSERASSPT